MIRIFTDSGSSIKPQECEALGVTVLPLMIIMNEREYRDGEELTTEADVFQNRSGGSERCLE